MFIALDESYGGKYTVIGSLWLDDRDVHDFEAAASRIRMKYGMWGEVKWTKRSDKYIEAYKEFLDLFFDNENARFYGIIITNAQQDTRAYNDGDRELEYFKFSYLLLHHTANKYYRKHSRQPLSIIFDNQELSDSSRYKELKRILGVKQHNINFLCPAVSHICSTIQVSDLLTGALACKLNTRSNNSITTQLLEYIEHKSGEGLNVPNQPCAYGTYKVYKWLFRHSKVFGA